MPTERSDATHGFYRDASQKFDYFVTGLTGTLTAYVGQTIHPFRLGANPATVELVALGLLVASVACGLKRIEATVTIYKLTSQRLYSEEAAGSLMDAAQHGQTMLNKSTGTVIGPEQAIRDAQAHQARAGALFKEIEDAIAVASSRYSWRNWLLFLGFTTLVLARILPAYIR
jgi:hypothetical protein